MAFGVNQLCVDHRAHLTFQTLPVEIRLAIFGHAMVHTPDIINLSLVAKSFHADLLKNPGFLSVKFLDDQHRSSEYFYDEAEKRIKWFPLHYMPGKVLENSHVLIAYFNCLNKLITENAYKRYREASHDSGSVRSVSVESLHDDENEFIETDSQSDSGSDVSASEVSSDAGSDSESLYRREPDQQQVSVNKLFRLLAPRLVARLNTNSGLWNTVFTRTNGSWLTPVTEPILMALIKHMPTEEIPTVFDWIKSQINKTSHAEHVMPILASAVHQIVRYFPPNKFPSHFDLSTLSGMDDGDKRFLIETFLPHANSEQRTLIIDQLHDFEDDHIVGNILGEMVPDADEHEYKRLTAISKTLDGDTRAEFLCECILYRKNERVSIRNQARELRDDNHASVLEALIPEANKAERKDIIAQALTLHERQRGSVLCSAARWADFVEVEQMLEAETHMLKLESRYRLLEALARRGSTSQRDEIFQRSSVHAVHPLNESQRTRITIALIPYATPDQHRNIVNRAHGPEIHESLNRLQLYNAIIQDQPSLLRQQENDLCDKILDYLKQHQQLNDQENLVKDDLLSGLFKATQRDRHQQISDLHSGLEAPVFFGSLLARNRPVPVDLRNKIFNIVKNYRKTAQEYVMRALLQFSANLTEEECVAERSKIFEHLKTSGMLNRVNSAGFEKRTMICDLMAAASSEERLKFFPVIEEHNAHPMFADHFASILEVLAQQGIPEEESLVFEKIEMLDHDNRCRIMRSLSENAYQRYREKVHKLIVPEKNTGAAPYIDALHRVLQCIHDDEEGDDDVRWVLDHSSLNFVWQDAYCCDISRELVHYVDPIGRKVLIKRASDFQDSLQRSQLICELLKRSLLDVSENMNERKIFFELSERHAMWDDLHRSNILAALFQSANEDERIEIFSRLTAEQMPNQMARSNAFALMLPSCTSAECHQIERLVHPDIMPISGARSRVMEKLLARNASLESLEETRRSLHPDAFPNPLHLRTLHGIVTERIHQLRPIAVR